MQKEKLTELLSKMTLAEKIGQLTQLGGELFETDNQEITGPIYESNHITEEQVYRLGSVIGVYGVENIKKIQETYLKKSRLKIPLLFMADVIHGARTIFPISLGLATSFNPVLAGKSAEIAAKEATAAGLHVTFSPMADLVRDPRWGRVMESTGEDPYLNSLFAEAFVKGFQGTGDLAADSEHLAACVKHFAAYGAAEAGREYNTTDMSENRLREFYLPAYQAAVKAGVKLVMTSFNQLNGIPATGNKWLMKKILRDEMGFKGVLITDYGAVTEQIVHGYARDEKEAAQKALEATVDIEMMTTSFLQEAETLVKNGILKEEIIDAAVLRILNLKNELGLFEDPYRAADSAREKTDVLTAENKQAAYEAAVESIVLLKNEEKLLPLKESETVAFVGTHVHSNDLLGAWSWKGEKSETERISDYLTKHAKASVAGSKDYRVLTKPETAEMVRLAQSADKVVAFIGESSDMTGESKSYTQIRPSDSQIELVNQLAAVNDNLILVVLAGRPLDLSAINGKAKAIFYAYFPGTMGAKAINDLLYGTANPSAKLTMSLPSSVGQIPVYYNNYNTGRPSHEESIKSSEEEYVSRYMDSSKYPLYPFGHGLSYAKFSYSDFSVSSEDFRDRGEITVSLKLKNTGSRAGSEVVQLYVNEKFTSIVRPLKELKSFAKIRLQKGEEKQIIFALPKKKLSYHTSDNNLAFEHGQFTFMIGSSSQDIKWSAVLDL